MEFNIKTKGKIARVLVLTYYHHPCYHPVMSNVFADELAKKADFTWVMKSSKTKKTIDSWKRSKVIIVKHSDRTSILSVMNNIFHHLYGIVKIITTIKNKEINIILIRDMPFYGVLTLLMKPFFRFKIYYYVSAPLGKMRLAHYNKIKGKRRYIFLFKGVFYQLLLNSTIKYFDIVFTITEYHKNELSKKINKKRIYPITMGVEKEWIESYGNQNGHLKKLKETYLIIIYFGTLSVTRNPFFILDVFEKISRKIAKCKFLMVGPATNKEEEQKLREKAAKLGLQRDIVFTGKIPREQVAEILTHCDISISPIPPKKYYLYSSPTKIYESLAKQVPVIGNKEILEQQKVLAESKGGILVNYNADEFADAAIYLLENEQKRIEMGARGKRYILSNYRYEQIAQKVEHLFRI